MKQHFDLSIPTPCHEKWSDFQPTRQGGYCVSCKKEVIDFTKWSEEQIKEFFVNKNGSTCGRFRTDQLKGYRLNNTSQRSSGFLSTSFFGIALMLNANQADATVKEVPAIEVAPFEQMRESTGSSHPIP